ncbi:G-patch domain and KOW motifs-containing protein [Polymixia lowei]
MASYADGAKSGASGDPGERKAGTISFGFTKILNKFKPSDNAAIKEDGRDYLTGVEGRELKSVKPVEKTKELIIPLIHKNRWCGVDQAAQATQVEGREGEGRAGEGIEAKTQQTSQEQDSVESQAVKELIEDSQRQLEKWQNESKTDYNITIPLLMQNQVPEGFEDGDKLKVDLRPESSTVADYDSVPVEAYGLAMLKGMGWKPGEGIGRTFKQDVKPIEYQLRPKGLGLGADLSGIKDLEPHRRPPPLKPGDERGKNHALILGRGGYLLVESGPHKDLYGKIEGVDPDNARVIVKLAFGVGTATVSQYAIKLVDHEEYTKYSKDLSRFSKAQQDRIRRDEEDWRRLKEREKTEKRERRHNGEDESITEADRYGRKESKKRKHKGLSQEREKTPEKKVRRPAAAPSWLQRDLNVRFIDKTFKGGRYYKSKMRVEDVLTPSICVCRTEEGRLLDDVKQAMVETVVPKKDSDTIMVVLGEHRGQVGHILQRDRDRCKVMVELDHYEGKVFTLDYDYICHYLGAGHH